MNRQLVLILISLAFVQSLIAQNKLEYLSNNRVDLRTEQANISETDFNIIGFAALHGSAKTYEAELSLIKYLISKDQLDYYIVEGNYSQAMFFQEYLETGNEELLEELVYAFQTIVAQEGTIDTFNFWKNLRICHLTHPIMVIGCDVIHEYRFPIKYLMSLVEDEGNWTLLEELNLLVSDLEYNSTIWNADLHEKVQAFADDYNENKETYIHLIKDTRAFDHVIKNMKYTLRERWDRDRITYQNYIELKERFNLGSKKQFAKYGYYHVHKYREGDYPYFFTRLIEHDIYPKENVITIMGYLTKSKVLWNKKYDEEGEYVGYTIKRGFGISDYWKEYYKGINKLKKTKQSDLTMFKLNQEDSPYHQGTDLIEMKMLFRDFNRSKLKGKNTLQFIDYAILISDSQEQVPIEELEY